VKKKNKTLNKCTCESTHFTKDTTSAQYHIIIVKLHSENQFCVVGFLNITNEWLYLPVVKTNEDMGYII